MSFRGERPEIFRNPEQASWRLPVAKPVEPIKLQFSLGNDSHPVEQPDFLQPGRDILSLFPGEVRANHQAPSFLLRDERNDLSYVVVREGSEGLEPREPFEKVAGELISNLVEGEVILANLAAAMKGGKSWARVIFSLEAAKRGWPVGSLRPDQSRKIDRDEQVHFNVGSTINNLEEMRFPTERAFDGLEAAINSLIDRGVKIITVDEIGLFYTQLHLKTGMSEAAFNKRFTAMILNTLERGVKMLVCEVDRYSFGNPWQPIGAMVELKQELQEKMLFKRLFPACVGCGQPAEISAVSQPHHWNVYLGRIPVGGEEELGEVVTVHQLFTTPEQVTWAIEQPYPPLCRGCNDFARPAAPSSSWPEIKWPAGC